MAAEQVAGLEGYHRANIRSIVGQANTSESRPMKAANVKRTHMGVKKGTE